MALRRELQRLHESWHHGSQRFRFGPRCVSFSLRLHLEASCLCLSLPPKMRSSISLLAALAAAACSAVASPVNLAARAMAGVVTDVQIHDSCNSTQRRQLTKALADMVELATVARDCASSY